MLATAVDSSPLLVKYLCFFISRVFCQLLVGCQSCTKLGVLLLQALHLNKGESEGGERETDECGTPTSVQYEQIS